MSDFIDNDNFMKLTGKDYFGNLNFTPFDFNNIYNHNNFIKMLSDRKRLIASKKALKIYKNLLGEEGGRELKMYFNELADMVSKEMNARKYAKYKAMEDSVPVNADYTFDKCLSDKQKKKLEKDMKQMKELTGLFENLNKSFRKYALYCALFCIVCPPAIFAMGGVLATLGVGLGGTEALKQAGYLDVVKQLECNGKNPYKNYTYANGYKKIEKLTEKEITIEDIIKAKDEKDKNSKNNKAKENYEKTVKSYVNQKA